MYSRIVLFYFISNTSTVFIILLYVVRYVCRGDENEFVEKTIWLCLLFIQEHYDRLSLDENSNFLLRKILHGKV